MKQHISLRTVVSAIFLTLSFIVVASAQETTASVEGLITDSNGATVKGANVSIVYSDKNVAARTFTTDDEGKYSAPNLMPGYYDITVEAAGFKKHLEARVKLDVGQHRTLDVVLEVGTVSEVVTVQSNPVAVELATPTVSTVVNGDQAKELSLNNRNWVQLVALSPGVSNDLNDQVYVGTTNPDTGTVVTQSLAVNGARSVSNS